MMGMQALYLVRVIIGYVLYRCEILLRSHWTNRGPEGPSHGWHHRNWFDVPHFGFLANYVVGLLWAYRRMLTDFLDNENCKSRGSTETSSAQEGMPDS